jgi:hypothetical protein
MDKWDQQEFYELMQTYRHTPPHEQRDVVSAFEGVKDFIRKTIQGKKELSDWLKSQEPMLEKLGDSQVYAGLVSPDFMTDPMCALQLGFAVLKNKPIFLIVDKNLPIPDSLVKVAKIIEKVDMKNPNDIERASISIGEFVRKNGNGKVE